MITRRQLLIALTAAALATPFACFAQAPGKVWRIGFIAHSAEVGKRRLAAFQQGMQELGYVEGKNFVLEQRYGGGKDERLPEIATELVRLKVDVLLVHAEPAALAAKKATTDIPIVMVAVADPVGSGLVSSLAHPGANITGLSDLHGELVGKRLQLLKEVVPRASRVAVLSNPNPSCLRQLQEIQGAARSIGVSILAVEAKVPDDIDRAFVAIKKARAAALIVCGDQVLFLNGKRIYEHAAKDRVPTIYTTQGWVDAGGLMSYGANFDDMYRRMATYVDKILRGTKPGDIPVEQPTKFEMAVNMKTAKALGIKIPNSILVRTDKVIE